MVQVGSFVMTKNTSEPRYHGYIHKARQGKARQGNATQCECDANASLMPVADMSYLTVPYSHCAT
jgi:hypothetical protein